MARYTEYVYEILQKAAHDDEDISNITDMTAVSERTLFKNAPLNVLSDLARSNFVTQFTLHYFKDELGLETLTLWRMALAEKLYNNSDYINAIYENLARQAYSEYESSGRISNGTRTSVGKASDLGHREGTNLQTERELNERNLQTANTGTKKDVSITNERQVNDLSDVVRDTGTDTTAKSGSDRTVSNSGNTRTDALSERFQHGHVEGRNINLSDRTNYNSSNTHSYNNVADATTYGKSQTESFDNYKTETDYGKITNDIKNSKQERSNTAKYDIKNSKTIKGEYSEETEGRNDHNGMGFNFDTPEGSLDDLRDPGGVPGDSGVGVGVDYANGQSYNYFSNASESDTTDRQSSTITHKYPSESGKVYTEENTETHNIAGDNSSFDKETVEFKAGTGDTQYGNNTYKGDISALSGKDTETKTGRRTDTLGGTDTTTRNGAEVDNRGGYDELSKSGSDTLTHSGSDVKSNTGSQINTGYNDESVSFGNTLTETKNLTSETVRTGSVDNTGTHSNVSTDDLMKTETGSTASERKGTGATVDNERTDHEDSRNDIDHRSDDMRRYKIDFLAWASQNNYMDKVWKIFDDLFMWLYN